VALAIAWVLVVARSAVFLFFEQSFFDSDQAIVGLMAKHLIEGRAFPLFYYGQTYLLGVDAWVAAPFFLVMGPTVVALHAALVFMNLAVVTALIVCLERSAGLRPMYGLMASLFFACAPPATSASLIEAGANIGPLLYVPLLWMLRDQPLWFGALLAFGFRNREFTIYALPVLVLGQLLTGTLFRAERLRAWLLAGVTFLAVWQVIEGLKPFADLMGPGTRGQLVHGSAGSEVRNILDRVSVVPSDLPGRVVAMATEYFPRQVGARLVPATVGGQGHDGMLWPFELTLFAATLRALVLLAARRRVRREFGQASSAVGWYLLGVGLTAAGVYALTRPATGAVVDRYILLSLYIPIGVLATFLAIEPRPQLRRAMVALVLAWAVSSAADHLRLAQAYWHGDQPNEMRVLADALEARGISVAEAGYWRAYKLAFLTRERVKVASSDVVRIEEYQRLADEAGDSLIVIQEERCPGDHIGVWFLCRAAR
jgi:hypothetical protein